MIQLLQRILRLAGSYRRRIYAAAAFSFLKAFFSKAPLMVAFLLIAGFIEGSVTGSTCIIVGAALVACVAVQCIFQYRADSLQSAAGFEILADWRKDLAAHLRRMPMGFFTEGNIGRISSVLSTDMVFIEENLMTVLADLMSYLFAAVIFALFMLVFDWRLGLLTLVVMALMWAVGEAMKKNTLMHSDERQRVAQQVTDAVIDFTEGMGIIKTYNMLGEKSKELSLSFEDNCEANLAFEYDYAPWSFAIRAIYGLGSAAMLALAWMLYQDGTLSLAFFVGMLIFVFELFTPLLSFYGQVARLTVMNACLDRIEAVFAEAELADTGTDTLPATAPAGVPEIEFRNVSFGYDKRTVLDNVSLSVEKDSMCALVGPSGSGKSTIANLLPRFWDVRAGEVLVRGKDVRQVPLAQLMDNISMVFQRVYLFQDTVFNNIAMGRADATREEVVAAARKAQAYDFIMALPDGFDTVIGEGGASLSGGEQQRISIARCILKDAPIIILDEATASVDADNESQIQKAIGELVQGKTLLVIAHRLNTIASADEILVVEDGRIVERGTHEQLMAAQGPYCNMVVKRDASVGFTH
ncbi:Putative multidrug export ATP-binding/permease protein SAV1866 [Slackia heliotrinireducens]|uniref:Fatty acid ABC transporter ATP-binding/permease protein n=1 Tax=Slackia heliotrinireducens (strain ATCC 29202 / DSM 20476 / NCTC 11029 / RHS 1) TaxID=471855 RepID=C7N2R9_SLAHD|nr:ABC transporter ATP-binding protein [Slackia heliotrinireducens]ACV23577.1 ABC-type multidrug transport system, ATPase and permease component [Slackia heliotrinireducens DSM 20476]VEH03022.1 Putative multidrug export ATP-binding/permease protein SAV1866 [Slackia heliotrinireducens]